MFIVALIAAFALAVFSHAAAHHVFGIPSTLGLSRHYPRGKDSGGEVQTTVGSLAGPLCNLLLGYFFFHFYRQQALVLWLVLSAANLFFLAVSTIVNFLIQKKSRNDLKLVSRAMGVPSFVLPCLMVALATPPLWAAITQAPFSAYTKAKLLGIMLATLLTAWLTLTLIDKLTGVRITLVKRGV